MQATSCALRRLLMPSGRMPASSTLQATSTAWSDSWYGRCLSSRFSRLSVAPATPALATSPRTTPMPPSHVALIRAPVSQWTRPEPDTGCDPDCPRLAWRAFAVRFRRALFLRLRAYGIACSATIGMRIQRQSG